jgi:nitrogen fixation protein FixH
MHQSIPSPHEPELTGRMVLIILLAFFGIVIGVNVVLMRAAAVTFGGLETESSYKAGLTFKRETSFAQAQNARGWQVEAKLVPLADATTQIEISARDANGEPIQHLDLAFTLARPTDKRLDIVIPMAEVAPGRFQGVANVPAGQWEFVIALSQGGERLFRSQNRVVLR